MDKAEAGACLSATIFPHGKSNASLLSWSEVFVETDVRKTLLTLMELLMDVQKRLIEVELRSRALQIVLAQATGFDLKSAETSLQRIVDNLRSEKVDEANQEASTIIQFLRTGKNPNEPDA